MAVADSLLVLGVKGLGEISPGDDLAALIAEHAPLIDGDVVVVTQKVVSKAEGRTVRIDPSDPDAKRVLAESESVRVLRRRGDLVVTETRHGFVCANSGVDLSNVADGWATLLPEDPDRSARRLRDGIRARTGLEVAVVISDTFGRAWRRGVTDVAIGCAGNPRRRRSSRDDRPRSAASSSDRDLRRGRGCRGGRTGDGKGAWRARGGGRGDRTSRCWDQVRSPRTWSGHTARTCSVDGLASWRRSDCRGELASPGVALTRLRVAFDVLALAGE